MSLRTMRPRQPERPRAHPWLLSEHPLSREEAMAGPFAKRFLHAAAALLWCGDQGCAEAATATRIGWPMPFRRAAPPSATTGREMKRLSLRFNPAWVGWWSCSAWRVTSGGHRVIIFGFRPDTPGGCAVRTHRRAVVRAGAGVVAAVVEPGADVSPRPRQPVRGAGPRRGRRQGGPGS